MGELFNTLLVNPTVNALLTFLYVFSRIGLPGAFGWSILALTGAVRLLFNPFYAQQTKMARDMAELKPHLDKLQANYKDNKQKLQQEQLKLYQERGINPAAGCIVALIQIPFFIALYRVILLFLDQNTKSAIQQINKVVYVETLKVSSFDPWFFGFNLTTAPSHFKEAGLHYLLIPLITAGLQYLQVTMQQGPQPAKKEAEKKDDKKKETKQDDFQQIMSKQMRFMFPLMIGYFSYILPVGLAIYWNIFSLFSILQYKKGPWTIKLPFKN